ncbi:TolC family protein [Chitinophaga solisilvae]|uniref:TolC family protein n=1 Tax=Chitinophaga solisilvae TaxID=1233460 RepID=UPI00192443B7|nr:TolC family protein [Chitinophaga solisilvae]
MNIRIILLTLLFPAMAGAQTLTMEQAVQLALQQNKGLKSADASVSYYRDLVRTSGEVAKTDVSLQYGQTNSYARNDNNFSISQTIPFPTVFGARKQLNEAQVKRATWQKASTKNELVYQVKQVYTQLLYLYELRTLLARQDSLFTNFSRAAGLRYKTGESRLVEKTAAEGRMQEVRNQQRQNEADITISLAQLQALLGGSEPVQIAISGIPEASLSPLSDSAAIADNPQLQFARQQIVIAEKQKKVYSAGILPDITVGYVNQSLIGNPLNASGMPLATGTNRFQSFQLGLAVPLWMGPMKARVKAEARQQQAAGLSYDNSRIQLQSLYQQAVQQFTKFRNSLDYYTATAMPNADLLLQQTVKSFTSGDIGYIEYFVNLENVMTIRQGYLRTRNDIKQAELYIGFLTGQQI